MTAETTPARRPATLRMRCGAALAALTVVGGTIGLASPAAAAETDAPVITVSSPSPVLSPGADLQLTVTVQNAGTTALPPGEVDVVLDADRISDRAALDSWLAVAEDSPAANGATVTVAVPRLGPSGTTSVDAVIPAEALGLAGTPWGVHGLSAEYAGGDSAGEGRGVVTWYSGEAVVPASVAVAVPLTAPPTSTGLLTADELATLTRPGGALTRQLEGLQGQGAAVGIDPMIIASIRALGTSAPASATEWLTSLEQLSADTFPLAWADSDLAVQAQAGLVAPMAPTSLDYALDPANFTPTAPPTPTAEPSDTSTPAPTEEPESVPTLEELQAFDYTQAGIAWPAADSVVSTDLPWLATNGLPTAIISSSNLAGGVSGTPRASATAGGQRVAVADSRLSSALSRALLATTDADWHASLDEATAITAIAAGEGDDRPILAALDRGMPVTATRLPDTLAALDALPWASRGSFGQVLGASPVAVTVAEEPESDERAAVTRQLVDGEAQLAAFSSALVQPALLTGPERTSILGLLGVGWIADPLSWNAAIVAHGTATAETLSSISVVHLSDVLVLGSPAQIPVSIRNDLGTAVIIEVTAVPSNGRLIVDRSVEATIEGGSSSKVLIPVTAQIGSGKVTLTITMKSQTGVTIGAPSVIVADVHADWEGLGAAILGGIVVIVFGIGIIRNIRRRRRERAAAAAALAGESTAVDGADAVDGTEADDTEADDAEAGTEPDATTAADPDTGTGAGTDADDGGPRG